MERTLVLVKPDGVQRGLTGTIIHRFELAGLKVVALKMLTPTKAIAEKHYPLEKEWYENAWANTKKSYEAKGMQMKETAVELGTRINKALMTGLTSGPVVAMVLEGNDAIANVRKIVGATSPSRAEPGSIRGTYSTDSYDLADSRKRAVKNIVHASDAPETSKREIAVWFTDKELNSYKRSDEGAMFD